MSFRENKPAGTGNYISSGALWLSVTMCARYNWPALHLQNASAPAINCARRSTYIGKAPSGFGGSMRPQSHSPHPFAQLGMGNLARGSATWAAVFPSQRIVGGLTSLFVTCYSIRKFLPVMLIHTQDSMMRSKTRAPNCWAIWAPCRLLVMSVGSPAL